jgi:hypothetical protein
LLCTSFSYPVSLCTFSLLHFMRGLIQTINVVVTIDSNGNIFSVENKEKN